MNLDRYDLITERSFTNFQFISVGVKGKIIKLIEFQKIAEPDVYNLAFGDKNLKTGELDDSVVTDNGDSEKVLATVVAAIYDFTNQYSQAKIYVVGSTQSRTRLYRMGINKYLDIAIKDFNMLGKTGNKWEWYEKDKNYHAFIVFRKFH